MEQSFSKGELDYARERLGGQQRPRFVSDSLGASHPDNIQTIEESIESEGNTLNRELGKGYGERENLPEKYLKFGTAFSLRRDYRVRYGTAFWRRTKGAKSRRARAFTRLTFLKYAGGGS